MTVWNFVEFFMKSSATLFKNPPSNDLQKFQVL